MLLDVILCAAIAMLLLVLIWCLIGRLLLPMRAEKPEWSFSSQADEAALERQVRAVQLAALQRTVRRDAAAGHNGCR